MYRIILLSNGCLELCDVSAKKNEPLRLRFRFGEALDVMTERQTQATSRFSEWKEEHGFEYETTANKILRDTFSIVHF